MTPRTLAAVALAAILVPAAGLAQDDWRDNDPSYEGQGWSDDRSGDGYDVSVDLEGQGTVDADTFHQPLTPYGDWVTVGDYGPVWRPRVAAGWRPYYYGRWEWTTEGWLWVSDEPFGWATYHYGRWSWDRGFGWVWVPGTQWAPAWVSWRYSGDVVGWAPLAPGLSLYVTDFAFVDFWWTFVPTTRFCSTPIHRIAYAPHYSRRWWDATRPAPPRPSPSGSWAGGRPGRPGHGGPAWGGPSSRFVEERVGRPLRPARIVSAQRPGESRARPGEIGVFRPEARPRPARPARDDRSIDRGSDRGRGWDDSVRGRPAAPAPGADRPQRDDRTFDRGPSRGWDDRRTAPAQPAPQRQPQRMERPSFERPDRGGSVERSAAPVYAPPPRVERSAAPTFSPPARSAPAERAAPSHGGDGGGRGGGNGGGNRPAPPRGEREHRR